MYKEKKLFGDNDKRAGYFISAKNCLYQPNYTVYTLPFSYHWWKRANCIYIKKVSNLVLFTTPYFTKKKLRSKRWPQIMFVQGCRQYNLDIECYVFYIMLNLIAKIISLTTKIGQKCIKSIVIQFYLHFYTVKIPLSKIVKSVHTYISRAKRNLRVLL